MHYREAPRCMGNASEMLRTKANKRDRCYQDPKYVRMACGTACNAVLLALDVYFQLKGMPQEKKKNSRTNVKDFDSRLAMLDKKMLSEFKTTYQVLHLDGYYEGLTTYDTIRSGMDSANRIVNKIRPVGMAGLRLN